MKDICFNEDLKMEILKKTYKNKKFCKELINDTSRFKFFCLDVVDAIYSNISTSALFKINFYDTMDVLLKTTEILTNLNIFSGLDIQYSPFSKQEILKFHKCRMFFFPIIKHFLTESCDLLIITTIHYYYQYYIILAGSQYRKQFNSWKPTINLILKKHIFITIKMIQNRNQGHILCLIPNEVLEIIIDFCKI